MPPFDYDTFPGEENHTVRGMKEALGPVLTALAKQGAARALEPMWADVVGPLAAAHCRPIKLEGATLTVRCDSKVWADAVAVEEAALVKKLDVKLGRGQVQAIALEHGPW